MEIDIKEVEDNKSGLIAIDPKANKSQALLDLYTPALTILSAWEEEANILISKEHSKETANLGELLKIKTKKKRVEAKKAFDPILKKEKARLDLEYKALGAFPANIEFLTRGIEASLQPMVDHQSAIDTKEKEALSADRGKQLQDVGVGVNDVPQDLHRLSKAKWGHLLAVETIRVETEKETKRIADEAQKEALKIEADAKKKLEDENKKLKAEVSEQKAITDAKIQQERKEKEEAQNELNAFKKEKERVRLEKERVEQEIKDKAKKEAQALKDIEDFKEANKIKEADQASRKINHEKIEVLYSAVDAFIKTSSIDHIDYLDDVANLKGFVELSRHKLKGKLINHDDAG